MNCPNCGHRQPRGLLSWDPADGAPPVGYRPADCVSCGRGLRLAGGKLAIGSPFIAYPDDFGPAERMMDSDYESRPATPAERAQVFGPKDGER